MPTEKYPNFVGVNLDEKTYRQLLVAGEQNERRAGQQARYWIKQGLEMWKLERVCQWMAGLVR